MRDRSVMLRTSASGQFPSLLVCSFTATPLAVLSLKPTELWPGNKVGDGAATPASASPVSARRFKHQEGHLVRRCGCLHCDDPGAADPAQCGGSGTHIEALQAGLGRPRPLLERSNPFEPSMPLHLCSARQKQCESNTIRRCPRIEQAHLTVLNRDASGER